MEFMYRIQLKRPEILTEGPTPEEERTTEAHFNHLQELAERGVVLLAGRTLTSTPDTFGAEPVQGQIHSASDMFGAEPVQGQTLSASDMFGIIVLRAESEAEARAIMQSDPGVRAGMWRADLFPFRIALVSEMIIKAGPQD